jgi:hypothetical protein
MPKKLAVQFAALLRQVTVKSLRSGDKGLTVMLEVDNPTNETIDLLNQLHDPTKQVQVGVWR